MNTELARQLSQWAISVSQEKVTDVIIKKLGDFAPMALKYERAVEAFTFLYDSDGVKVAGYLVAPKVRTGKLPVIIYNRGGTADFGLIPRGRLFTRFAQLANQGYMIIGSQYPGNKLSEGKDERGGNSDVASVLRLRDLIVQLDCTDENKIGMYGDSRGGMMTYLCMKEVEWIKVALTVGGLANLERSLARRPEMLEIYKKHFGNTKKAKDERSVVKWANKLNRTTPLCLLHGGADKRVSPEDAIELASQLQKHDYPYALHILKNGDHGLMNLRQERDRIIKDWFTRHLKESHE